MARTTRRDPMTLLNKFTLTKRGRTRATAYKKPRDRLIDSLGKQIEILHVLQEGRNPKTEGYKERKMFFEEDGRYLVQVRYNNTPLDLTADADTVEVDSLEDVEEVLKAAIDIARISHFDEQVNRIAADWAEIRRGSRGPRKRPEPPEEE